MWMNNKNFRGHYFMIIAVIAMLAILLQAGVASAFIPVDINLNKNLINFKSSETFTVDILSDATFNATTDNVNISSITFGGAPVKKGNGNIQFTNSTTGLPYLELQFQLSDTSITCGNLTVFLLGYTNSSTPTLIVGSSNIALSSKFCTPGNSTPIITSYSPLDLIVTNNVSENRTFSITTNQFVNVNWSITGMNGPWVQSDENVTESSYTNNSAPFGNWNVVAIATNSNGTATIFGNAQIPSWLWIVSKVDTSTSVTSSPNPSIFGQPVTFTATVDRTVSGTAPGAGTPTGAIEFFNGSASLGTGSLSGNTATISTSALGIGSNSIIAVYSGDNNFSTSTSPAITQTVVSKVIPTIIWSNPADIVYGTALSDVQLNATASVNGSFVYTPPNGTVLGAGNGQTLHVDFTPTDTTNYTNTSASVTINVTKANATITVTNYSVPYDGHSHTATGTATGVNGTDLSSDIDLSGTTHTNAGTYTDTWHFIDPSGNYENTSGEVTDTISQANTTSGGITISVTGYAVAYDGTSHTATGTATGVNGTDLSSDIDLSGTTHTNAGIYTDTWHFIDPSGNYENTSGEVTDTISQANSTTGNNPPAIGGNAVWNYGHGGNVISKPSTTPIMETPEIPPTPEATKYPTPLTAHEPVPQTPTNWGLIMLLFALIGAVVAGRKYQQNSKKKRQKGTGVK